MEKVYIFKGFYYFSIVLKPKGEVWGMKKIILDLDEENIYEEVSRDLLLEDDELSPEEEAFMRGYEEAG